MGKKLFSAALFLAVFNLLIACTPAVKVVLNNQTGNNSQITEASVQVFEEDQPLPQGATEIGKIKISDTGFSFGCSYEQVLNLAKKQTVKAGGNALKTLDHKLPDYWSTCHRIEAAILITT